MMAMKAVHVSEVPNLDQVPENPSFALYSNSRLHPPQAELEVGKSTAFRAPKFLVIGHRGSGMNIVQSSSDGRMKAIKENSILSFNYAANYPLDYIEFDVQVTKDGCPIIFHDDFIYSQENGMVYERRVTDLSLAEFLGYGPQKEAGKVGKTLLRKTKDGRILNWRVEADDSFCTLQEAFQKVPHHLGFNVELKFDDHIVYEEEYMVCVLEAILQVVFQCANGRPIIFSSFHPDAAMLVKKLVQSSYPVFFLTNGGCEVYYDQRRNSLEDAIEVCLEGGLQGIVSEVKGILRNPSAVNKIKETNLSLITYGKLNNVVEAVHMQQLMGVEGVIVDYVEEITEAVSNLTKQSEEEEEEEEGKEEMQVLPPQFSKKELSFLLKLIPELLSNNR